MKVFGIIPTDENQALTSLNEGVPLAIKKPMHPISRAFTSVSKDLVQIIKNSNPQHSEIITNGKNKRAN